MSKKTHTTKNKSLLESLIFASLCILLFYPPFFRGLFFEKELLPTHIFSFIIGVLWMISKFKDRDYKLFKSYTDLLAAGIVAIYLISTIYAVNKQLAILEAFKYANYFIIYILSRDLLQDTKRRNIILNILVIAGGLVSIVGLGSAIGTWSYNGAYVGGRINSTFQYPNTLASYLAALIILITGLLTTNENKLIKGLYASLSSIMFMTFILTYSRGMWLIFPFVILAFIILVPSKIKMQTLLYTIINIVISTPGALLFGQHIENGGAATLWAIVILTAAGAGITTYLLSLIENKLIKLDNKRLLIALGILAILGGLVVGVALNQTTSLTMENDTNEVKYTSLVREIGEIEPLKDYFLEVDYDGQGTEEANFFGRIYIQSIDEDSKVSTIKTVDINESENNELNIDFTTPETINSLRLVLRNQYPETKITFNEVNILDENNQPIKSIPLKYKYIPEQIVSRISSISLDENSAGARFSFYKDAFKIIKDYPIFGAGGGGWVALYKMYQSYQYHSTQAHNYFMQLWIEVGTIGLILFTAFILLFLYKAYRSYRNSDEINVKLIISALTVSVISILLHAVIDFDLSLAAITFVLWAIMGMLAGFDKQENLGQIKGTHNKLNGKLGRVVFISIMAILLLTASSFSIGNSYARKAIGAFNAKEYSNSLNYFQQSIKHYPVKPEYKMDLSNFYISNYKNSNNQEYLERAIGLLDDSQKLVKYNAQLQLKLANTYMSVGQFDKGLNLLDEAVKVEPLRIENYLAKTQGYIAVADYYLKNKDIEKAKPLVEEIIKVKEDINNVNGRAFKSLKFNNDLLENLGYIKYLQEDLNGNNYDHGDNYTFKYAYYFDIDMDNNDRLDNTTLWNNAEDGNITEERQDSFIKLTNDGSKLGMLRLHKVDLKSNTNYKLFVKAKGNYQEKNFRVQILNGKSEKQSQTIKNVKLNEDQWGIEAIEFKTEADIDGTSEIRFRLEGNDEGYVDLEEIVLFER